jgi:hypothetical protein
MTDYNYKYLKYKKKYIALKIQHQHGGGFEKISRDDLVSEPNTHAYVQSRSNIKKYIKELTQYTKKTTEKAVEINKEIKVFPDISIGQDSSDSSKYYCILTEQLPSITELLFDELPTKLIDNLEITGPSDSTLSSDIQQDIRNLIRKFYKLKRPYHPDITRDNTGEIIIINTIINRIISNNKDDFVKDFIRNLITNYNKFLKNLEQEIINNIGIIWDEIMKLYLKLYHFKCNLPLTAYENIGYKLSDEQHDAKDDNRAQILVLGKYLYVYFTNWDSLRCNDDLGQPDIFYKEFFNDTGYYTPSSHHLKPLYNGTTITQWDIINSPIGVTKINDLFDELSKLEYAIDIYSDTYHKKFKYRRSINNIKQLQDHLLGRDKYAEWIDKMKIQPIQQVFTFLSSLFN